MTTDTRRQWVLICNPENRRRALFAKALEQQGFLPPLVVSYEDLLSGNTASVLRAVLAGCPADELCIKLDSPGENFQIEKALIALGTDRYSDRISATEAATLSYEKGRFYFIKEWYAGFCQLLQAIDAAVEKVALEQGVKISYLNTPAGIAALGDKQLCQNRLQEKGVPVPELIVPPSNSFDGLVQQMYEQGCYQVFVKPRYGSSACGVMALRVHPKRRHMVAYSSLQLDRKAGLSKGFNSLKLQRYSDPETIQSLFDMIMAEDAYIERWLPKARLQEGVFDVRMMVIHHQPRHYIARCSSSPLTNLHLGNRRGTLLAHPKGERMLQQISEVAQQGAAAFPECRNIGLDILCSGSQYQARVIELNAFGDLLPGVLHEGMSTYECQSALM